MDTEILQKLGLTKNEIKVYITILKLGSCLAGEITRKSDVHRRNVYDAVERLVEKGLVSFITKNNRKWFEAVDQERFLGLIKEKEDELKDMEKDIQKILPELKLSKGLARTKQEVQFFKGREGLKTVYDDILRTGKSYVGYGRSKSLEKILRFFLKHYVRDRVKKKINIRLIYEQSAKGASYTKTKYTECRYIPNEMSSNAALRIYGDKVAILLLSEEEPLAIVIESKAIADGYRKYFEVMWKAAKE